MILSIGPVMIILSLIVFTLVIRWQLYLKAGQPGWASIVPFYNLVVLMRVIGRSGWWSLLFFIPLVNAVWSVFVIYRLARVFGRGWGFAVGLILLPIIFYPILAFGAAQYRRPVRL